MGPMTLCSPIRVHIRRISHDIPRIDTLTFQLFVFQIESVVNDRDNNILPSHRHIPSLKSPDEFKIIRLIRILKTRLIRYHFRTKDAFRENHPDSRQLLQSFFPDNNVIRGKLYLQQVSQRVAIHDLSLIRIPYIEIFQKLFYRIVPVNNNIQAITHDRTLQCISRHGTYIVSINRKGRLRNLFPSDRRHRILPISVARTILVTSRYRIR